MSRSGYSDYCENIELYRATVERSLNGKRGQAFLRELLAAMDATPEKDRILIAGELINGDGDCCAIGLVCKSRGMTFEDIQDVDVFDPESVAKLVNISYSMAAEIEFMNDDDCGWSSETPEERWLRMRKWVVSKIQQK